MNTKTVYLTVDDGPSVWMFDRACLLAQRRIPAVFFCVGELLAARAVLAVEALRLGIEVGNHSWSHPRSSEMTLAEARGEVDRTDQLIEELYARASRPRMRRWFRFPYGDQGDDWRRRLTANSRRRIRGALQDHLRSLGYSTPGRDDITYAAFQPRWPDADWPWTFDSCDWRVAGGELTPAQMLRRLDAANPRRGLRINRVGSADIVLVHDGAGPDRLFEQFVEALAEQPVRFALPV